MQKMQTTRRTVLSLALATATAPLFAASLTSRAFAQQPSPDDILGIWEADDGSVKLDMFKSGSEYRARLLYGNEVVEADNATFKQDTKNPDPKLRSRSLKHIIFLWGLTWANGEWTGGSLYDGSSGRTYSCNVKVADGKLLLHGYIGLPALGQTRPFHRASA